MKKIFNLVIITFLSIGTVVSQNTEEREIETFDKIEVFGNIKVEMKKGDKEALMIEAVNVKTSDVISKLNDKLLKIKMNSNLFEDDVKVKVIVTYKELREITSNGSAEVKVIEEIDTDKIFVSATSGGRILVKVKLNAVDIKAYQGAHVDISGSSKLQESFINTGGVLSASNLICNEVFIKMNTGGQAEINVNKRIEANVNTGAKLSFFGKPEQEELSTSLGGKITKWDEE